MYLALDTGQNSLYNRTMSSITTSLDWPGVQTAMDAPALKMKRYSYQMMQISKNIGTMVTNLGNEEINCRREHKQTRLHKELIAQINAEIENYESLITFAVLLGV